MARALILIDIQNDYFVNGTMELVGMDHASANAARVLNACREDGTPRFHVQHLATRAAAGFFLPGTSGAEIHRSVLPRVGETVTQKHFPNAFRGTALAAVLKQQNIDELVIVGAMSHMCIDATTRAAFDLGFTCTVVEDACATRDLNFGGTAIKAAEVHGAFMAALGSVYARIVTTDALLGA